MKAQQKAQLNYLRIAPRKVRSVADLIKGLSVNEAEAQLLHERRRASKPLLKLLRSAVSNAKSNKKMSVDSLYIESIRVDGGPMLKRMLPRARGMATPLQKKTSHVTLVLSESEKPKAKRFTMVVRKKAKKVDEDRPRSKTDTGKHELVSGGKARKPGFFRRVFSRKSQTG